MTPHQKASKRHAVFQRRLRVAELAGQGRTQREIANELGVSQPTICADLNEIHAEWRQAAEAEAADRIAREIAMIEQVRRAAWQGWERSQQDQERKRVKTTATPDQDSGVKVERTKEQRTQSGDSKMLQTVLDCSEMILRTLGAFKTKATPASNGLDTVLQALYRAQATNPEDDAERIERRVKEMPAGAEAKAEESGARRQGPGAREENAETPTSAAPAPVSDAEPEARGCLSSRQAGGLPYGREGPTSAAPVSDAEPGAQVPPCETQTPEALAAEDPRAGWLTARRGWHRVATISSGGLANPWPLGRRP